MGSRLSCEKGGGRVWSGREGVGMGGGTIGVTGSGSVMSCGGRRSNGG